MKKSLISILLSIVIVVSLVGCSSKKDERTMDDFIKAFSNEGIKVDEEMTTLYQIIGASNGVNFISDDKIAVYEYNSVKELEKLKKSNGLIKKWESNGRFLLESTNKEAIDIFNSVKQ